MPLPPSGNLVTPLGRLADDTVQELQLDNSLNLKVTDASRLPARGAGIAVKTENANLAAGANTLYLAAIPANKIYRVNHVVMRYAGSTTGVILDCIVVIGGVSIYLSSIWTVSSWQVYPIVAAFIMNAGDKIQMDVANATAGNYAMVGAIYEDVS
jgi:hypothetical protein